MMYTKTIFPCFLDDIQAECDCIVLLDLFEILVEQNGFYNVKNIKKLWQK